MSKVVPKVAWGSYAKKNWPENIYGKNGANLWPKNRCVMLSPCGDSANVISQVVTSKGLLQSRFCWSH